MNINWKYVKPLNDQNAIDTFETKYNIKFPEDLKYVLKHNNGGRPSSKFFDIGTETEHEFKTLLSFNYEDVENIYDYLFPNNNELVPFATDPSGNLFCCYKNAIYYWRHERNDTIRLADTFSGFLEKLY